MNAKWKKRILAVCVLIICSAIIATGTAAYFTAEETAYNVIITGLLDMNLVEETEDGKPWPADGMMDIVPGMDVGKVVYVENRGNAPFFARLKVEQVISPAPGSAETLSLEYITLDLNSDRWIEKDGFYYYYRILQPGEKTEPLFTKVSFAPEMGNAYMNATLKIYVMGQSVQSDNNGYDPLMALGWTEAPTLPLSEIYE